jgi:hypothetical protein
VSDQVEEQSHPGKSLNSSIVKPMVDLTLEISGKEDSDSESGLLGSDSDSESYSDSESGKQSNDSESDPW